MKIIKNTVLAVVFLSTLQGISQEILTKKEALKITLENNFGIKIANNNLEVAKNNSSIYNTGFLPTASLLAQIIETIIRRLIDKTELLQV